jgi:uncharacterized protein (UPF0332 family)
MISEQDRDSILNYRLGQATDTIELARFLINSNKLIVAVNRIYYGMYYSLTALALKHKFETSKHHQLIGWFNKEFVATKIVDTKYGKMIRNAFQNRRKGDYDAFVHFTTDEVESMLLDLVEFIDEIKKLVK